MGVDLGTSARWTFSSAAKFFIFLEDAQVLTRMPRARADVRKTELLEQLADVAFMVFDPEPLGDDRLQVDPPPPHDAIDFEIGASFA